MFYKFVKVIVLNYFNNLFLLINCLKLYYIFFIISFVFKFLVGLDEVICFLGGIRLRIYIVYKKLIFGLLLFLDCVNNVLDGFIV